MTPQSVQTSSSKLPAFSTSGASAVSAPLTLGLDNESLGRMLRHADITAPETALRPDLQNITDIRNAAKLGAKFFQGKQEQVGSQTFSLCSMAFDVGLILALAGEKRDVIVAGILHEAFSTELERSTQEVQHIIQRKFGARVSELIAAVSSTPEQQKSLAQVNVMKNDADRDVATLSCAINIALLETGNRYLDEAIPLSSWSHASALENIQMLERQLAGYQHIGVPEPLLAQFREAGSRFARRTEGEVPLSFRVNFAEQTAEDVESPADHLHFPQLLRKVQDIRDAAQLSSALFERVPRKWGPEETLPLSAHTYEVAMLLALAGESRDVIVAGLLHDVFENYVDVDVVQLRGQIRQRFGVGVLALIEGVTEPPKSMQPENWWERKLAVLYQIRDGDKDLATLVCAAKISTLAAGNKMLYMGRPVSDWSSGSLEDNVRVFNFFAQEFERKGVSPLLLDQFNAELALFRKGTVQRRLKNQEAQAAGA